MQRVAKRLFVYFLSLALVLPNFSVPVYAGEISEDNSKEDNVQEEGNEESVNQTNSGTFGSSNGFRWTFDKSTYTLTVTGEDEGINQLQNSVMEAIRKNVKKILFQDCVVVDKSMPYMFSNWNSLTSVDLSGLDISNVQSLENMFTYCWSLTKVELGNLDTSKVTDMSNMFSYCSSLTSIDLSGLNMLNVLDIGNMFENCLSLTSVDMSGWDISNVLNVKSVFKNCTSLKNVVTPKAMASEDSMELPTKFLDSEGNVVSAITSAHCNKTLTRAEQEYNIVYVMDGGQNHADNPATYKRSSETIELKKPKKTGYTFNGWYSDSRFTQKSASIPKGSVGTRIFYAKWLVNKYNIAFKGNGNTGGSMKKMSSRLYDKTYTLKENTFKRTGYTFTGWNTKADGSGTSYDDTASVRNLTAKNGRTVNLYAQWKIKNYKITYKLYGGDNSSDNPERYNVNTGTITLKKPSKEGYKFVGWYSDKKCTKKVKRINKGSTGNITLYAKWKKNNR